MQIIRRLSISCLLIGTLLMTTVSLASANPFYQNEAEGEGIFQQKCVGCHTLGGGKLVGPDLLGVTERREPGWLRSFISAPDQVLTSGDPLALQLLQENNNVKMPNLGLTAAEVEALLVFLKNPGATTGPVDIPTGGKPDAGERLFTGETGLANGGTGCIACHSVAGVGTLGGGNLGPDLTQVLTRYGGEAGLASALASLPFPTMGPVFADHPLSIADQADLLAFFNQTSQRSQAAADITPWFWGAGIAGALALFGLMLISWPRQRISISDRLRKKA